MKLGDIVRPKPVRGDEDIPAFKAMRGVVVDVRYGTAPKGAGGDEGGYPVRVAAIMCRVQWAGEPSLEPGWRRADTVEVV